MRLKNGILFILIILLYTCGTNTDKEISSQSYNNYVKIPSSSSGIDFINKIEHDLGSKSNLFDYDYFYNGSGVGVADFNNDGLKDVFLCANQAQNRIYLNKGGLSFEDITEKANINTNNKGWSSGVTFADINTINPNFIINPDIRDEDGQTFDIGFRGVYKDFISYDLSSFYLFYNNRIGFVQKEFNGLVKNEKGNVGDAKIVGQEMLLNFNIDKILNMSLDYKFNYFIN